MNAWKTETRKGRLEGGGTFEETERVKELNREDSKRTIEATVLSDVNIDSGGNKSTDTHKGYHYVALLEGKKQLSFAFEIFPSAERTKKLGKRGWRVLSNDCVTFARDVKTKKEAIELLAEASKGVN